MFKVFAYSVTLSAVAGFIIGLVVCYYSHHFDLSGCLFVGSVTGLLEVSLFGVILAANLAGCILRMFYVWGVVTWAAIDLFGYKYVINKLLPKLP